MIMTSRKTALAVLFLLGTLQTVAAFSRGGGNLKGAQRSRQLKKGKKGDKKKKEPKKRDCDIKAKKDNVKFKCKTKSSKTDSSSSTAGSSRPADPTLTGGAESSDAARPADPTLSSGAEGSDPAVTEPEEAEESTEPEEAEESTEPEEADEATTPEKAEESTEPEEAEESTTPEESSGRSGAVAATDSDEETIIDEINFEMKFDDTNGMTVTIEYHDTPVVTSSGNSSSTTDTKTKFNITFDKVIEYQKGKSTAAGEAYDWESDKIVKEFPLLEFATFGDVEDDGTVAKVSSSTIPSPMGQVIFTFTVSRGDDENLKVPSSNKVKIDFELVNYAWAQNDTYVALMSTIMSERQVAVKTGRGAKTTEDVSIRFDDILDTTETGVFGAYTWASDALARPGPNSTTNATATAGNQSFSFSGTSANTTVLPSGTVKLQVVATSPSNAAIPGAEQVAFSFIGDGAKSSSDLYWDPEVGVGYASAASQWTMVLSSACIVAMTLLGLVL